MYVFTVPTLNMFVIQAFNMLKTETYAWMCLHYKLWINL